MLITIFTPTYNRAYTLKRVFDSLMSQSFSHSLFEWILIDDGSTDNTKDLVKSFLKKTDFKINYIYQKNMGKNYCHNRAIELAQGDLFLILDSDDAIVDECLEVFWNIWTGIEDEIREDIYGVSCLCKDGYTNELIGHAVEDGLIENAYKWKHENRIYFDSWGALNAKLFKKILFPQLDNIKFIPEAYLWDKASNRRKVLSTNKILKIVYYQNDGFSNNILKSYVNHSKGRYIYHKMVINELFLELLKVNSVRLVKDIIQFIRMGFHSKYSLGEIINDINNIYRKLIVIIFIPIGLYFYIRDNYKENSNV